VEVRSHRVGGILLRTSLAPGVLEPVLTKTLADVDPSLTIISVRTLHEQVALSFNQERAVASLAGLFGAVALLLAAVGLYGVTAYMVAQRTNEIGIRMALGATGPSVVRRFLGRGLRLGAIGAATLAYLAYVKFVVGEAIGGLRHLTAHPGGTTELPPPRCGIWLQKRPSRVC